MKTNNKSISLGRYLTVEEIIFLNYAVFSISWMAGTELNAGIIKTFELDGTPSSVNSNIGHMSGVVKTELFYFKIKEFL